MNKIPQKIAVRLPNWLGDCAIALGFLRALRSMEPDAELYLIGPEKFKDLFLSFGDDKYISAPASRWRSGLNLRKYEFDHYYVLPPSFSTALEAFLSGAKVRVGFATENRGFLLTKTAPKNRGHLHYQFLNLLDKKLSPNDWWPELNYEISTSDSYIVLAPGAAYGPAKKWPLSSYRKLAELLELAGTKVVVTGSPGEKEDGDYLGHDAPKRGLYYQNTLGQTIQLLAGAKGVVSNDSGLSHVTAALGVPQISIFGSSDPQWTSPLNPNSEVMYNNMSCSPCFKRECPYGHYDCLEKITPEQVYSKAINLFGIQN